MKFLSRWIHNRQVGRLGEDIISEQLKKRGLKILAHNWQLTKSELDIVAVSRKLKTLHIIEVKSRTNDNWEEIASSLSSNKVAALRRGANEFLSEHRKYHSYTLQFDVAVVLFKNEKREIVFIENIRF